MCNLCVARDHFKSLPRDMGLKAIDAWIAPVTSSTIVVPIAKADFARLHAAMVLARATNCSPGARMVPEALRCVYFEAALEEAETVNRAAWDAIHVRFGDEQGAEWGRA